MVVVLGNKGWFQKKRIFFLTLALLCLPVLTLYSQSSDPKLVVMPVTAAAGQMDGRLVLLVESKIRLNPVTPGQAGWETEAKGEVYLQTQPNGKFSGIGNMSVPYRLLVSPNPYFKYSTLKGQGNFVAKGKKEGKNLRFWFEHRNIPVKGALTISMPHMSKREPYETMFDPYSLAPGDPLPGNGVMIELRDGATAAIDVPGAGKTDFSLYGVETWRVSVVGEETDNSRPYIQNPKLTSESKELPIAIRFHWNLVGEFTLAGRREGRRYLSGQIFFCNRRSCPSIRAWGPLQV
jgi:hypothetical protein